jgi:P27 family predicted phage terminase small subunit
MPRKAKPIDQIDNSKAHKTQAEITQRQSNQLEIGTDKILVPDFVLQEPEAKNLWDSLQDQLIDKKLLNNFTAPAFAVLCDCWAKYVRASELARKGGVLIKHKTKDGEAVIQNPAILVMTKTSDQIKKYACEFYLTPAAIASYARNNQPAKPKDPYGEEFI